MGANPAIEGQLSIVEQSGDIIDGQLLSDIPSSASLNDFGDVAFFAISSEGGEIFTKNSFLATTDKVIDRPRLTFIVDGFPSINNSGDVDFLSSYDEVSSTESGLRGVRTK